MSGDTLADQIDVLLPQTQCAKCGYSGCRPYARAIAAGEAEINQCPPGGAAGIGKLAALLGREAKPLNPSNGSERERTLALIDETRCIGCTLCIQACPVDAIVGAAKLMHTVIAGLCTGCELCVPPCPVDCIDMAPVAPAHAPWTRAMADAARARFDFRKLRLARKAQENPPQTMADAKKAMIRAALERAKARQAAIVPKNTDHLPPQLEARIAAIDARRLAAKKR